jgi:hypothetical protein
VGPVAAGLGVPIFYSDSFGSGGSLKLVVQLSQEGFSTQTPSPQAFCLITHEILHRWAAYTGAPLASASHWTNGALARTTSGFGTAAGCVLNDLELYLAGLLPLDSVADPLGQAGYRRQDLIASFGPRLPAWPDAQKDYTIGFVIAVNGTPDAAAMAYFHAVANAYSSDSTSLGWTWRSATGHRSTLNGELTPGAYRRRRIGAGLTLR